MPVVRWKVVRISPDGIPISCVAKGDKYRKNYIKGEVVRATKGTLGIMTFNTYENARRFMIDAGICKILKVLPIGKGKVVDCICDFYSEEWLDKFYENSSDFSYLGTTHVPEGTICYKAVKVIE